MSVKFCSLLLLLKSLEMSGLTLFSFISAWGFFWSFRVLRKKKKVEINIKGSCFGFIYYFIIFYLLFIILFSSCASGSWRVSENVIGGFRTETRGGRAAQQTKFGVLGRADLFSYLLLCQKSCREWKYLRKVVCCVPLTLCFINILEFNLNKCILEVAFVIFLEFFLWFLFLNWVRI